MVLSQWGLVSGDKDVLKNQKDLITRELIV